MWFLLGSLWGSCVVAGSWGFCRMGTERREFGVWLVSRRLLNHKHALNTDCIQGVMLSILVDGIFTLIIFKSVALYIAFYETTFKWKMYRLGYKRDLSMNSDHVTLRDLLVLFWEWLLNWLLLTLSFTITLLISSSLLHLITLFLAWTHVSTLPEFSALMICYHKD